MPGKSICAAEKAAWTAAAKKFRDNEAEIGKLDKQLADAVNLMRGAGRPAAEIAWAQAVAQTSSAAEAADKYNQQMALTFELRGNSQASRVCSMAKRRGGFVEKRPTLDSDHALAEEAYRKCVENAMVVSGQKCGQPRTGHGHEGEPCQITLGMDGVCQYHGAAIV